MSTVTVPIPAGSSCCCRAFGSGCPIFDVIPDVSLPLAPGSSFRYVNVVDLQSDFFPSVGITRQARVFSNTGPLFHGPPYDYLRLDYPSFGAGGYRMELQLGCVNADDLGVIPVHSGSILGLGRGWFCGNSTNGTLSVLTVNDATIDPFMIDITIEWGGYHWQPLPVVGGTFIGQQGRSGLFTRHLITASA